MSNEATEEVVKPDYQALLTENYAIDTDKLNIILKERFAKRDGKGKFAPYNGEYGWRELGYFKNMSHVADYLVKHELMKEREVGELRQIYEAIESLRDEIVDTLSERVTVVRDEGNRKKDTSV